MVHRLVVSVAIVAGLASAGPAFSEQAPATSDASIIQAKDHAELNEKWCAADPSVEHVIVLPASLFVDSQQLVCNGSIYKLYRVIENDDPDAFYEVRPPFLPVTLLGGGWQTAAAMTLRPPSRRAARCRSYPPRG